MVMRPVWRRCVMLMVSILCDRAGIIRGVTITAICLQMVIFIIRYPDIKPDTMIHPGARREEPACGGPPVSIDRCIISRWTMQWGMRLLYSDSLIIKLLLLMLYLLCFIWTSSFPSSFSVWKSSKEEVEILWYLIKNDFVSL